MKKIISVIMAVILAAMLAACGTVTGPTGTGTSGAANAATDAAEPAVDQDITAEEATGDFELTTTDGSFSVSGSVYTLKSAGTYTASGLLEGQIVVDAGETDAVVIELSGATLTCGSDSPIKVLSAGSVDISAKKDTENVINDTRSAKTTDAGTQGEGAIYANCDLKIKGSGTLVVTAGYNNGIHTTKDLTVQNLSLKVTACNNALKGNDSVTVTGGTVAAISANGNGVKTENTDVNKNGATRGDILLTGGSITVYAAGDGFEAARNFEMAAGEDGSTPTVTVYTGSYSGYTASGASTTSYKGVKVQNELNIKAGSITLQTYDDGLHADGGTLLGDGTKGAGTVNISGGEISIDSAYEGLEANVINVSGGRTVVAANDDGVNACKGSSTPAVNVTGGYLDVTVSPNGDTDGIDSNGTYKQTGGVVIARGPNNQNMAAIDADNSVSISGGTLIVLGYGRVSASGSVKKYTLSLHSAGSHTVTVGGESYTFTNASAYGSTACYSDVTVSS